MSPQEEPGRGRWGTAAALVAAAMRFPVLDWLLLLAVALSALLVVLPPRRPATGLLGAAGLALALVGFRPADVAERATLAWVLAAVAGFALATLARPAWTFFPRALAALAAAAGAVGAGLAATGAWGALDGRVQRDVREVTAQVAAQLTAQAPAGASWTEVLAGAVKSAGEAQWTVFPALAALQTLAGLALGWWLFARFAPHGGRWAQLGPLREFRFSDHLVWVAIAGLVLLLLPLGAGGTRAGANALVFMGGLYALRGLGVFLFATRVSPLVATLVLGLFALSPLSQFVLVAALMVGLGDTWLDLRKRGTQVSRA
ncbi:MAG TPA: DUF2232 domain-containing protein [Longimicrobiaceae bacterium]|nr:DUF2232 domain-containing protein [Longimicrobiaceae bacterium]